MAVVQQCWKTLSLSLADAIFTISMNRPKVNAMTIELLNDLEQAFDHASKNDNIKGVHLRSNLRYTSNRHPLFFTSSFFILVLHFPLVWIWLIYMNDVHFVNGLQSINFFLRLLLVVSLLLFIVPNQLLVHSMVMRLLEGLYLLLLVIILLWVHENHFVLVYLN
jgi:hypothetical protein